MSVLIVTSVGDIVVDLHTDRCPLTCKNFLKLCKIKYYNGCLFHKVEKDFTAQTGDRTGTGAGGDSVYKFLYGDQARFFDEEIHPDSKHSKTGTVAMASAGENLNASQFYFTLRDDLDYLDGKHTVFGVVEEKEGLETLAKINETYVDAEGRPFKDIRIKHTYILDDPFSDPPELAELVPDKSPEGKPDDEIAEPRLEDDWVPMAETLGVAELEEALRSKEAHTNAAILESIGDIPDADVKPPENVLFVCKLNPVTQDEDLHTIFSRFGNVVSADIIRDYKTGDSLCYAFIEFELQESCEQAYLKMNNTLIDDRRIHVDFSQSVAKLWTKYRHGKKNQTSKGSGCFKCGAPDHIAKDCDQGSNGNEGAPKYVLKDDNTQRGGDKHRSYEMVFDGDTLKGSQQHDASEDRPKKQKMDHRISEDSPHRGYDRRGSDSRDDRDRHVNGSRSHREDDRIQDSRRGEAYYRDRMTGEGDEEKHGDKESRKQHESSRHGRDEETDRPKRDDDRLIKDRKRSSETDRPKRDDDRLIKDRKRSSETDRPQRDDDRLIKDRHKMDERDYRKEGLDDGDRHRKDGGDHGKRSKDREVRDHRKESRDSDSHRRENEYYGKRSKDREVSHDRERRHRDDEKRR